MLVFGDVWVLIIAVLGDNVKTNELNIMNLGAIWFYDGHDHDPKDVAHTVDGRYPAPTNRHIILLFVVGFAHPCWCWMFIFLHHQLIKRCQETMPKIHTMRST